MSLNYNNNNCKNGALNHNYFTNSSHTYKTFFLNTIVSEKNLKEFENKYTEDKYRGYIDIHFDSDCP